MPTTSQESAHLAARAAAGYIPPSNHTNQVYHQHANTHTRQSVVPPVGPMSIPSSTSPYTSPVPSTNGSTGVGVGVGVSGHAAMDANGTPMTTASEVVSSSSASSSGKTLKKYLWNMDTEDIREWLNGAHPLFPKQKVYTTDVLDDYGK